MKCDTQLDRVLLTFSYFMHTNKCFRIVYLSVIGCHRRNDRREEYNVFIITVYLTAHKTTTIFQTNCIYSPFSTIKISFILAIS